MQQSLKTLLSLVAVNPILSIASPLTYPHDHKWNFSAGTDCGIETFHMRYVNQNPEDRDYSSAGEFYGSGLVFGLNQSFGYSKWFYIQAKESATIATDSIVPSDREDDNEGRSKGVHFIDADIRAYFPLRITQKTKSRLGR